MKILLALTFCSIVHISRTQPDYKQEGEEVTQQCYSCSSQSALCRDEVYDGTYLTKTPCRTKCFVRREGKDMYRGCFDGWLGGMVKYSYEGCRTQKYLGQAVEWCFCTGSGNIDDQPCNAQSPRDMGSSMSPIMSYSQENEINAVSSVYQGIPVPDYKEFMQYAASNPSQSNIEAKEGPALHIQKYKIPDIPREEGFPPLQPIEPVIVDHPCAIENSGPVYDPRDCNRYYLCSNGIPYHMKCPYGTVWNQRLRGCAFDFDPSHPCEMKPMRAEPEEEGHDQLQFNNVNYEKQYNNNNEDAYNEIAYGINEVDDTYYKEKHYVGGASLEQEREESKQQSTTAIY